MKFVPTKLDFELSPYTGFTRDTWIEAGTWLLEGIFSNIKDFKDPVVMERVETEVSYPHSYDNIHEVRAEYFEGLTRSFFTAAVIIHENPEITLNGIKLKDYYKSHILRSVDEGDKLFVGSYESLCKESKDPNPFRAYQQTVETCALVIGLDFCKSEIWDTYTKEEKDKIAAFLKAFAEAPTVPQNWRMFNMLDMAFLYKEGYEIDESVMTDHAAHIVNYYAGDGWYRDGHSFDYYSCWAFNMYGPLWCKWYGYDKAPKLAKLFERASDELMETYDRMYDREGHGVMWGRSGIYRNATTSAFDGNFFLNNPKGNPGIARRISSGCLMQFFGRDDFRAKGIPTLGYYGQFSPLIQGYSCAESPLWLGKAMLCLHLPKDHPFWTAKEELGIWDTLGKGKLPLVTALNAPGICISNHGANGDTVLRTGKVDKKWDDFHGMHNYSKLSYFASLPWDSGCGSVQSMQYIMHDETDNEDIWGNQTLWAGLRDQVLYRRIFFKKVPQTESHWTLAMDLADIALPKGILRVDRPRLHRKPETITLGALGFPDNGTTIEKMEEDGVSAIILKGQDSQGVKRSIAFATYSGFEKMDTISLEGTNADSKKSILPYATYRRDKLNHYEDNLLISAVFTAQGEDEITKEDIFCIKKVTTFDEEGIGGYGPIDVELKDGQKFTVDFDKIEGNFSI